MPIFNRNIFNPFVFNTDKKVVIEQRLFERLSLIDLLSSESILGEVIREVKRIVRTSIVYGQIQVMIEGCPKFISKLSKNIVGYPFSYISTRIHSQGNPFRKISSYLSLQGYPILACKLRKILEGYPFSEVNFKSSILGELVSKIRVKLCLEGTKDFKKLLWLLLEDEGE